MITSGSLARHPPAPPGDLRRAVADRQETGLRWHPTPSHTALGTTSPPSHSKLVRDLLHPVDVWGPAPPKSVGSGGRGWQWGSAKGRTSDRCQASGSDPRAASLSALLEQRDPPQLGPWVWELGHKPNTPGVRRWSRGDQRELNGYNGGLEGGVSVALQPRAVPGRLPVPQHAPCLAGAAVRRAARHVPPDVVVRAPLPPERALGAVARDEHRVVA
eukprot:CAMPEP_0174369316 /NCGR_PEP_ID=MMETSP0811_2-20130205/92027_1 /TAXON_ID=73025 ORGANISM="Eutreptiella gymnastica-like, Strain CCMP1594" /NCGR_SAMPLE_ID=MMETSP0811_2 /ASSEMBLY_ACC=CAM_ASM_000667 /LENGTH=215 /DNA_ID=CAMNT_0015513619 /DNA_START=168 /DNA_END=810 /DNA_ORIENTATION=+